MKAHGNSTWYFRESFTTAKQGEEGGKLSIILTKSLARNHPFKRTLPVKSQ